MANGEVKIIPVVKAALETVGCTVRVKALNQADVVLDIARGSDAFELWFTKKESRQAGDWESAVEQIDETLSAAINIESENAGEFVDSVSDKLESIRDWVTEHRHVTEAQLLAIANIAEAIAKWRR